VYIISPHAYDYTHTYIVKVITISQFYYIIVHLYPLKSIKLAVSCDFVSESIYMKKYRELEGE
jgi:hypothetical protein